MTKKKIIEILTDKFTEARCYRDNTPNDDMAHDRVCKLSILLQQARKLTKEQVAAFAATYGIAN